MVSRAETDAQLVEKIEKVVAQALRRQVDEGGFGPWQIAHAVHGLGREFKISFPLLGNPLQQQSGLNFMLHGTFFRGFRSFTDGPRGPVGQPYQGGSFHAKFEGHSNQFLAYLAPYVSLDTEVRLQSGKWVKVRDLVETVKKTVPRGPVRNLGDQGSIAYTVWILSHFVSLHDEWRTNAGELLDLETLVQYELGQRVETAFCGGAHHLSALASALKLYRLSRAAPPRGIWLQVKQRLDHYWHTAHALQNADGSLSAAFFRAQSFEPDVTRRVGGNGHVFEFLADNIVAYDGRRMSGEPWVRRAAMSVAQDVEELNHSVIDGESVGAYYHALHGLRTYRDYLQKKP